MAIGKNKSEYRRRRIPLRAVLLAVGIAVLLSALFFALCTDEQDRIDKVRFVVPSQKGEEAIALYQSDGVCYAFLPSYADLDTVRITCSSGSALYIDGAAYTEQTSCVGLKTDVAYPLTLKNHLGITTTDSTLIIKQSQHIPAVSIRLSEGTIEDIHADKTIAKPGAVTITRADGSLDYTGRVRQLHGRGNTTWEQPKKSYTMELSQSADLLGMGEGSRWVLLANSFDESSLRNKLAYDTAKALGVEYAVDSEYVDLYVDGVYRGLYMLCEKIEVGKGRVDITDLADSTAKVNTYSTSGFPVWNATVDGRSVRGYSILSNPADVTGGYLLQAEHHDDRIRRRESVFATDELSFSLTSPKYATREQIRYISEFINRVEDALAQGDLSDIDVESFVRYYLIQELFANNDNCSVFFYKDADAVDPTVHACAIWDFDESIGNGWLVSDVSPRALYRSVDNWFDHLCADPQFRVLLSTVYADEVRAVADQLIFDKMEKDAVLIHASFDMDKLRWRGVEGKNDWADRSQQRFDTLEEHTAYIRRFMTERLQFLDDAWINGTNFCTVTFSTYDHTDFKQSYAIPLGEPITVDPNPETPDTADYVFLGWYDASGNPYSPGRVIQQNESYTARWALRDTSTQAKIKEALSSKLSWLEYDIGLLPVAIIGVFGLVLLILFVVSIRKKRGKRSRLFLRRR